MLFSSSKSTLTICLALASAFFARSADAAIIVSVDWDNTLANGIQSSINANVGDTVTASIVFELTDSSSVSTYQMSTRFSSSGLSFVSRTALGLANLAVSPAAQVNVQNTNLTDLTLFTGNYGENQVIAGNDPSLLGNGPIAPTIFSVSTIQFTVLPGAASGLVLQPGVFVDPGNIDVFFDNALNDVTGSVVFNGGSINVTAVPEPSTIALLSAVVVAGGVRRYRTRKNVYA